MGFKRLAISTLFSMKPAIQLYERCGATFVKSETIDLHREWDPLILLLESPGKRSKLPHEKGFVMTISL